MRDIMMNMEKQLYTSPQVEIILLQTQWLMDIAPDSDKPVDPAPARRDPAF